MKRNCTNAVLVSTILIFLSSVTFGQAWSGIVAPTRALDWTQTGIPGGIPSASWAYCATTACNTLYGGTVTSATINAAIASAPKNSVVRIPSGTYSLSADTYSNRSNVVLRGAGPGKTIINTNGHDIFMGSYGTGGQGASPSGLATKSLSTYAKGSTVLALSNTTGLSAGQIVMVDERNNSTYVNVNGFEGVDAATRCESPLAIGGCSVRAMAEMQQIVSVDSGTQITVTPGLSKTYSSSLSPQIFYWANNDISYNGVEDLTVNQNVYFAVSFVFCHFCWAKDVAVVNPNNARSNVYFFYSYRGELRDSYLSGGNSAASTQEYGVELDRAFRTKVENNIFFGITSSVVEESSTGNVIAYNYVLRTVNNITYPTMATHRAHIFASLYEGNVAAWADFENTWGSVSHSTAFRNRLNGYDPNSTGYNTPAQTSYYNRYQNFIGNVLGTAGVQTQYECSDIHPQPTENYIYGIGGNGGCAGASGYDPTTRTSLLRWGNWDTITNAVRWCGTSTNTGWSKCSDGSEVPTGDPNFSNPVPSTESLPASFLYNSRPAWFGTVAWPPIGPDVANGSIAGTGGHANKIPAQLCYENTAKNSGGFLTGFDASTCYSGSGSTSVAPATGLSVVVH